MGWGVGEGERELLNVLSVYFKEGFKGFFKSARESLTNDLDTE